MAMSDEDFAALQAELDAEKARREAIALADEEARIAPIRAVVHGAEVDAVLEQVRTLLLNSDVIAQRNFYMALEGLRQSIDNAKRIVPIDPIV